ncbi:MAG: hypothetical protein WAV26_12325 [Candidatus Deferrimicrobium sp.]
MYEITIHWQGPMTLAEVFKHCDAGKSPFWNGKDYGLYQIYGRHILDPPRAKVYRSLLYIGEATEQTFASRFREHVSWLKHEWTESISIHVGRFNGEYANNREWKKDVLLAERVLIYTYSPHYNSSAIANWPRLPGHKKVAVIHRGKPGRLRSNVFPKDWE